MIETVVRIDGMMCGMCEAHICDAVRAKFPVKKVSASHSKGQAVILSQEPLDTEALRRTIGETGYDVKDIQSHPAQEKNGFLGLFKK